MTAHVPATGSTEGSSPETTDRLAVRSSSSSVTGMTIFVASEAVFFAAFFGIYANSYAAATVWPPSGVSAPKLLWPTIAVAVLLVSGLTMTRCLRRVYRADYPSGIASWLLATFVGSLVFSAMVGLSLTGTGFHIGQGIYESLFYIIVGLELAHGIGGAALLGLVLLRARTGELALRRDPVQSAAIYWYFVVVLGVAIYLVLYLALQ